MVVQGSGNTRARGEGEEGQACGQGTRRAKSRKILAGRRLAGRLGFPGVPRHGV